MVEEEHGLIELKAVPFGWYTQREKDREQEHHGDTRLLRLCGARQGMTLSSRQGEGFSVGP